MIEFIVAIVITVIIGALAYCRVRKIGYKNTLIFYIINRKHEKP